MPSFSDHYTAMESGDVGLVARGTPVQIAAMIARMAAAGCVQAGVVTDAGIVWVSTRVDWGLREVRRVEPS